MIDYHDHDAVPTTGVQGEHPQRTTLGASAEGRDGRPGLDVSFIPSGRVMVAVAWEAIETWAETVERVRREAWSAWVELGLPFPDRNRLEVRAALRFADLHPEVPVTWRICRGLAP